MMTESLQLALFTLTVLGALISLGAAVVAVINARRPASAEVESTVSELLLLVERMQKDTRKERMSRVRRTATEVNLPEQGQVPSPEAAATPEVVLTPKQQLRELARQKGYLR